MSDFAEALLPGTVESFIGEGERLYELTEDIDGNGGAQVVLATFLVEDESHIDDIERSDLFNQWRIGKNDMGVLILLIFTDIPNELSGESDRTLIKAEIELGYQMEQYITANEAAYLIDDCLYNPEWDGSLDMGLGEMLYEMLTIIYTEAYGYDSFNYDMEEYRAFLIDYTDEAETDIPMSLIIYLLSPYSSFWSKFFTIGGIVLFLLLGGGGIFAAKNRGGGGRSGGYGVRR